MRKFFDSGGLTIPNVFKGCSQSASLDGSGHFNFIATGYDAGASDA